jgi:DNA-binding NtrC family response regulator
VSESRQGHRQIAERGEGGLRDKQLPRLLIIDDLFGRALAGQRNEERANLCGQFLIEDVTGDEAGKSSTQRIKSPIAQAFFCRGQRPTQSKVGDYVENDLEGAMQVVEEGWLDLQPTQARWAMVLLDLCFYTGWVTEESNRLTPGMPEGQTGDNDPAQYFGLQLLRTIHERFPDLPVIILSSQQREQVSREFTQYGALTFLPRAAEDSPRLLRDYLRRYGLIPDEKQEIIGQSKSLLLALREARRAAFNRRNILIRGERGTGKELFARYIHRQSEQDTLRPFVTIDSGTLNPQLYASELFGYKRGAFTGADRDRKGRIAEADGGDLFLDEIGNMPPDVQIGLLRVLEQGEVTPLGVSQGQPVEVRFLSATNENLESSMSSGGFRPDLLDRLRQAGTIYLPPLRERLDDIDLLVESMVREAEESRTGAMRRQIEPEALYKLRSYDWPGNIRELRSCIFNAVFNYPDVEHLQPVHLVFGETQLSAPQQQATNVESAPKSQVRDFRELLSMLSEFNFEHTKSADLLSALPPLQEAYANLAARLLKAALHATSKPSPDNPEGKILIHPAIKLLTGNRRITASKAADIIKRLLGEHHPSHESLMADPILKDAYQTALRLRPRQPTRKNALKRTAD